MLFAAASRPDIISFAGGMPHPLSFPLSEINEVAKEVIEREGRSAFQYGPSEGYWELREFISQWIAQDGIKAHPEDILITDGAQQALDLLGKIFVDPGDPLILEAPSYVGALNAFLSYQADIIGVPVDDDGLQVELLPQVLSELEAKGRRPKFLYAIPNFQNPAGVTLSLERRKRLVEIVGDHDILLVEDDAYGHLRFEGKSLPTLKSMNEEIIYVSTFSKIFSPGIRVGWLTAPHAIVEKLCPGKEAVNLCPSPFTQRLLLAYLKRNDIKQHVKKIISLYRERRDAMLSALEEFFPEEARWTRPRGGLFIWATLPSYIDTTELLAEAISEAKVAFVPGQAFFAKGRGAESMRLNFSYPDKEAIHEGIKRLSKVIKKQMELYRALQI
jgi:2-aminoadipate transaminase